MKLPNLNVQENQIFLAITIRVVETPESLGKEAVAESGPKTTELVAKTVELITANFNKKGNEKNCRNHREIFN